MKSIYIISILIFLILLYIFYIFNKLNIYNLNNEFFTENKCSNYFFKKKPQSNIKNNIICDKLLEIGWNPNWKRTNLYRNNKFTKQLNKKIKKKIGVLTTKDIKQCFPNF